MQEVLDTKNVAAIRASVRARQALAEPKADVVATYVTSVERSLFHDEKAKLELADAFQQYRIVWFLSACAYLKNSKKYAPKYQVR